MVSRQEMGRQLLTPGEVMQLPTTDEIVMIAGLPPVRARKLRYYEEREFTARILPAPTLSAAGYSDRPVAKPDDWSGLPRVVVPEGTGFGGSDADPANGGIRQEPELPEHEAVELPASNNEFAVIDDEPDDEDVRGRALVGRFQTVARQAAMDRDDGMLPPL